MFVQCRVLFIFEYYFSHVRFWHIGNKYLPGTAVPQCSQCFGLLQLLHVASVLFFTRQIVWPFFSPPVFDTPPILSSFSFPLFPCPCYPFHRYFYFSLFYRPLLFSGRGDRPQNTVLTPLSSSRTPRPTLTRIWPLYTRVSILSTPYINPVVLPPLLKQQ